MLHHPAPDSSWGFLMDSSWRFLMGSDHANLLIFKRYHSKSTCFQALNHHFGSQKCAHKAQTPPAVDRFHLPRLPHAHTPSYQAYPWYPLQTPYSPPRYSLSIYSLLQYSVSDTLPEPSLCMLPAIPSNP